MFKRANRIEMELGTLKVIGRTFGLSLLVWVDGSPASSLPLESAGSQKTQLSADVRGQLRHQYQCRMAGCSALLYVTEALPKTVGSRGKPCCPVL